MAGCGKKADPATTARIFFEQIAAGKLEQAYQSTAFGFQADQSEKSFEAGVRKLGLSDAAYILPDSPKIEGSSASLEMNISTKSGGRIALAVVLTEDTGEWRIFSIHTPKNPATGLSENPFTEVKSGTLTENKDIQAPNELQNNQAAEQKFQELKKEVARVIATPAPSRIAKFPLPDEQEVRRLVRENLVAFDQAVAKRSFLDFYNSIADKWKEEVGPEQLEKAFLPFVQNQFRLGGIENAEPVYEKPPAIDADGLLIVSGACATQPYRTVFSMKFYFESSKWKLFGLDVNLMK